MKIAVAMSGGIDSSITATLLKEQGYEVIGLTMQLIPPNESACCSQNTIEMARNTAYLLGIPHYVVDFRDLFARNIIDYFCREYSLGMTPNPCVMCNILIKFGALWEKAAEMGAEYIATGHYARIEYNGDEIRLKKGIDIKKDQSYFLCRLTLEQLRHAMFPIGHLTKAEVRRMAHERGLPAVSRPESQEICFIHNNDYTGFLKTYQSHSLPPGPILDNQGNLLGEHKGIASYTIGQRHGLGVAATEPLYVTAIAPERNAVVVGTKAQTYCTELVAGYLNWTAIDPPGRQVHVKARVRYRHPEADATLTPLENGECHVKFSRPQMAVAPGQTVAFYDNDTVLGGGMIVRQGR